MICQRREHWPRRFRFREAGYLSIANFEQPPTPALIRSKVRRCKWAGNLRGHLCHQLGWGRAQFPRQVRTRPTSHDPSTHKKGAVLIGGCAGRLQRNVGLEDQPPDETVSLKLAKAANDAARMVLV